MARTSRSSSECTKNQHPSSNLILYLWTRIVQTLPHLSNSLSQPTSCLSTLDKVKEVLGFQRHERIKDISSSLVKLQC